MHIWTHTFKVGIFYVYIYTGTQQDLRLNWFLCEEILQPESVKDYHKELHVSDGRVTSIFHRLKTVFDKKN